MTKLLVCIMNVLVYINVHNISDRKIVGRCRSKVESIEPISVTDIEASCYEPQVC